MRAHVVRMLMQKVLEREQLLCRVVRTERTHVHSVCGSHSSSWGHVRASARVRARVRDCVCERLTRAQVHARVHVHVRHRHRLRDRPAHRRERVPVDADWHCER